MKQEEQPRKPKKFLRMIYRDPLVAVAIIFGLIVGYPISEALDIPYIVPVAIISYVLMMSFVVYAYFKVVRKKKK